MLILFYRKGWRQIRPFIPNPFQNPGLTISVIIPARNEEKNIGNLLQSIQDQSYPSHLFEVIVIDDHSEDNTAAIAKRFPFVKLINLDFENINSYKKKAIETGIVAASGELIVTTDADCLVKNNWLSTIAAFKKESNAVFIAAPVVLENNATVLETFQTMDFIVLQGITAASVQNEFHNMCNGANLAYEKKAFYAVDGFTSIDHIASGDDMLLMQKIALQYPGKVAYLLSEDVVVKTKPEKTWAGFFNQRIRWASKATSYHDLKIFSVLLLVYFFNCCLLALLIAGCWLHYLWFALLVILFIKILIELFFIAPVASFYKKKDLVISFPLYQPLHVLYTVIAGWLGTFGSFKWKGRRVK